MAYDKAQFEAAFQLITAVSHQIIRIDFTEVEIWVDKLMSAKAMKDADTKKNMDSLKAVMRQFNETKKTLTERGVPVRDVSHYRESVVPGAHHHGVDL